MIPVNSVVFSASVAMLLSLINLGSATALNALLSLGAVSQMATCKSAMLEDSTQSHSS